MVLDRIYRIDRILGLEMEFLGRAKEVELPARLEHSPRAAASPWVAAPHKGRYPPFLPGAPRRCTSLVWRKYNRP